MGTERQFFVLDDGASAKQLLRLLAGRTSKQSEVWQTLAVAVNGVYASQTTALRDGDEVALLPPVSGGMGEAQG